MGFLKYRRISAVRRLLFWSRNPTISHSRQCSTLDTAYKPGNVEARQREKALQTPPSVEGKQKFTMILPPPNVTGNIHLGHALTLTIQDVIARWKRKQGFDVTWVPGTDHAGIATQVIVEKILQKEQGLSRHQLGREKFLEEVRKWKESKVSRIRDDIKELGATLNWEKEYFTMDENLAKAVNEAFIRLFERDLIYRGEALVNWSCALESAISDIEVENLELSGPTKLDVPGYNKSVLFGQIYDIVYKFVDGEGEVVVSTTRPETLLGDVAVAVHPDDMRHRHLKKGVKLWHPFRAEPIPVVFDGGVDSKFGTGAVKITPAHDKNDFDTARRQYLSSIPVINEKGRIVETFGDFSGLPRFEAREKILNLLADQQLLRGTRPHAMNLPICSRSKDVIEFLIRPQWFVRADRISKRAEEALKKGTLKIRPDAFHQEWHRWLSNLKDWCISRQLWWGHQIPAYEATCGRKTIWVAAKSEEEALEKAKKKLKGEEITLKRDQDVLDTWFSSALLPFTVFGWPDTKGSLRDFYPLSLMETGHDILFFWVARMVMLGMLLTNDVPFKEVLLHGVVCDAQGRKMSKSLGNTVTPGQVIDGISLEDLAEETRRAFDSGILSKDEFEKSLKGQKMMFPAGIPECGTDALRFTLCSHNVQYHFINFDISECHSNKLFLNKVWQATRYTLGLSENFEMAEVNVKRHNLQKMDRWILGKLAETIKTVEKSIKEYNFHFATMALKNFLHGNLCNTYLETTKETKQSKQNQTSFAVLSTCLVRSLELMEVFTPFLFNELRPHLPANIQFEHFTWINPELDEEIQSILKITNDIRKLKSQKGILWKHDPVIHLYTKTTEDLKLLREHKKAIKSLTHSIDVKIELESDALPQFTVKFTAGHLCWVGIQTNDLYEPDKVPKIATKDDKKLITLKSQLSRLEELLTNEDYRQRAKAEVQERNMVRLSQLRDEIEKIKSLQT